MSSWEIFKTILKQIGFYRSKLMLFLFLVGLTIVGYLLYRNYRTEAIGPYYGEISEAFLSQASSDIEVKTNGTVLIDKEKQPKAIKFYVPYDELRIMIFDQPTEYISYYVARVHLPKDISESQVRQITYAVHGVGGTLNYMADSRTLVYEATDISPGSTLTIVAQFPKGYIMPSWWNVVKFNLAILAAKSWLYIAIVLPGITLIVIGFMLFERRSIYLFLPQNELTELPTSISPAISGVLVDGAVGAREIAATLIDLAHRGYIFIINQGNQFYFARRKLGTFEATEGLSMFEKALLSKIFLPGAYKSTLADVEMRIGRHIFSRKIANFYLGVYNQATSQGYFKSNPGKVHLAYKYTGIVLFFLTFLGFIYGGITETEPKFSLLFWVGGMFAASLIIKFAPYTPARTRKGNLEFKKWLAFRNYLTEKAPVSITEYNQNKFENYLPYAIVLGSEIEWVKRFADKPFNQPSWYEAPERIITIDDFANKLFPLIGYVADNLARSHDPIVE